MQPNATFARIIPGYFIEKIQYVWIIGEELELRVRLKKSHRNFPTEF